MSTAKPQVKRTYGARTNRTLSTYSGSSDTSPPTPEPAKPLLSTKRKRPLLDLQPNVVPLAKKQQRLKLLPKKEPLVQLHFITDSPIVRTCALCDLTYTRGAPDDEALHKAHCARVQRGFEWRKEDEGVKAKGGATEVQADVRLKSGETGRILCLSLSGTGKLRQKLSTYLQTINTVLSAPDMTDDAMKASKAYLFLLPAATGVRETVVGCAVAQRITTAMAVATLNPNTRDREDVEDQLPQLALVHVDGGLFCNPERLPTPAGIPRLFVSSVHRRKGIAEALLDAICGNFIHGCQLDPLNGELAFSQPTSLGRTVMEKYGKGGIRVFEE